MCLLWSLAVLSVKGMACARSRKAMLHHSLLSSQGWSSFTTGASKFASAAKEGVSNSGVYAVHHWPRVLGSFHMWSPF